MRNIARSKLIEDYDKDMKCILADKEEYIILKGTFPSEVNLMRQEVRNEPRPPVVDYEDINQDIVW